MIGYRFQRLIEKLLSVKFVIFVIATFLRCFSFIGNAEWLTVALAVIAGREVQKLKDFNFKKVTNEKDLGRD